LHKLFKKEESVIQCDENAPSVLNCIENQALVNQNVTILTDMTNLIYHLFREAPPKIKKYGI